LAAARRPGDRSDYPLWTGTINLRGGRAACSRGPMAASQPDRKPAERNQAVHVWLMPERAAAAGLRVSIVDPLVAGMPGVVPRPGGDPAHLRMLEYSARECLELAAELGAFPAAPHRVVAVQQRRAVLPRRPRAAAEVDRALRELPAGQAAARRSSSGSS